MLRYRTTGDGGVIRTHNACFGFTIPATAPAGPAGLKIIVRVHDGGPVTYYPIASGNIVVHC